MTSFATSWLTQRTQLRHAHREAERQMRYEVAIPKSHPLGINWIHPHVQGLAKQQVSSGMTSMIEIGQAGQQLCRQTQGGGKACAPIDATRVKHMLLKDAQLVPNDTAYAVQADEDADFCGLNKFDVVAKANCAVVMATQSLSDATRSGLLDVLLESCPFRFFGANPAAMTDGEEGEPGPRQFYQKFGLTDAQIELIRHATPKRHYLIDCPDGSALIDLRLGRTA